MDRSRRDLLAEYFESRSDLPYAMWVMNLRAKEEAARRQRADRRPLNDQPPYGGLGFRVLVGIIVTCIAVTAAIIGRQAGIW